ncbi:hypothetical protein [Flammeovirga pacifica]|uniref:Uncharacterized protein n=1 Tax=Flammeovirga pacifica TaxID=915059 RepID=A0A1S1YYM2_FLAPC|nr:hypothetical protein [Flammeovirga pacifica]OHX66109.1 hypothetical protein NH26_06975 [Flammeovirga pacifica]
MKKLILFVSFILINITLSAQSKEQAIMALRAEEHTKVTIEDNTVIFTDHFSAIEDVENYNYLALELAESLYNQMCDEQQNYYFNALFTEDLDYQNIIECKNGVILNLKADTKGIQVVITTYPDGEVANEYFSFND